MIRVNIDRGRLTVLGGERAKVARALLDIVEDKNEVRTVTGVPGGFAFVLPERYRDQVHNALVAENTTETAPSEPVEPREPDTPVTAHPPARNASAAKWEEFLTSQGLEFEEGAGRDDLIETWDRAQGE